MPNLLSIARADSSCVSELVRDQMSFYRMVFDGSKTYPDGWLGDGKYIWRRTLKMLLVLFVGLIVVQPASAGVLCVGDCDAGGVVEVSELVQAVRIAVGEAEMGECPACDVDEDGAVQIDELVAAVDAALHGCPIATASPTPTDTPTSTPTMDPITPWLTPLPTANTQPIPKCGVCNVFRERKCTSDCIRTICGEDSTFGSPCEEACVDSCDQCEEGTQCVEVLGSNPSRAFIACIEIDPVEEGPQCLEEFPGNG